MLRRIFGVKCYDSNSKKVYYLYKSELDGSFIKANIVNTGMGTVWVKAAELKQSTEVRHPPLNDEQRKCVMELQDNLRGLYDLSYEDWELGFRKDRDIDKNIAIWLFFSSRLKALMDSMILDEDEKRDLFRMMVAVMNNGKDFAINNMVYCGQIERLKSELVAKFISADREFA
jgi:hypothetical protein